MPTVRVQTSANNTHRVLSTPGEYPHDCTVHGSCSVSDRRACLVECRRCIFQVCHSGRTGGCDVNAHYLDRSSLWFRSEGPLPSHRLSTATGAAKAGSCWSRARDLLCLRCPFALPGDVVMGRTRGVASRAVGASCTPPTFADE